MDNGHLYFIDDQYFLDFTDPFLMRNKETVQGQVHDLPCFYAFKDNTTNLYWMIPFSSQIVKYRAYYNAKIQRFDKCDTIDFGFVLGFEKAFLIQNMCPVTSNYIQSEYIDRIANVPVRMNGAFEKTLILKARRVLALQRNGIKLTSPDVVKIEAELLR